MRGIRLEFTSTCLALAVIGPAVLLAQSKPANATAQCKDGSYSTAKSKEGACSSHGGIQTWYADEKDTVKSDAKAAGKSTKDAAASAGKATASAGKVVGKGTKDASASAGKATANAAGTAAKKTEEGAKTAGKATEHAASATANAVKPKPSDAPKDSTAKCKDGSYSTATQHKGACSGHGGVAEWYK
jgi:uncharacterized protein DUF3761